MAQFTKQDGKAAQGKEGEKGKESGPLAKYKGSYAACVADQKKQGKTPEQAATTCKPLKTNSDTMNEGIRGKLFGKPA
jgi:hypothetical protein